MAPWTTLAVLDWTTKRFTQAQIENPRLEAQILVAHALGCTKLALYTQFDKPLGDPELATCRELIKRRLSGLPLAYVVGDAEFWGLTVKVTPDVLVPRNDTETLVEVVVNTLRRHAPSADDTQALTAAPWLLADVCTGSGAIAVALAKELPNAQLVATDISPAAADIARRNVAALGFAERVSVVVADLLPAQLTGFHAIVSNPPYIASDVIATLAKEVLSEPRLALDGGPDGLVFYRRLVALAKEKLAPGGWLFVEHGFDQAAQVTQLLSQGGFTSVTTVCDLGKQPRVTSGRLA